MAMRLLPKSEVNKAKALDRQREIDEGKKLATRVDTLRELAAQEDENLGKFRDKMVSQIMEDIKPLQEEYDSLGNKITQRKRELGQLMQPIDALWADVNKAQAVNNDWEAELSQREVNVAAQAEDIVTRRTALEVDEARAADVTKRSEDLASVSVRINTEAKEFLAEARNEAQTVTSMAELRQQDSIRREEGVAARERDADIREGHLSQRERHVAEMQRAVADQYATMQRTIKRQGK